ncbi:E3 ubiquitin-protein ligase MSL2-like [Clytia hemisphaerica]|uniref:E3 ubiquitin-protein ligase MSL2-like n=1 Tax=Clytia hemisphaerica TaxID=252671 RepID=UPI0034D4A79A
MNATILYTQLSHEILKLDVDCNDEKLSNFMKNDRGFYKLRSLLLCRACRDLCIEPFSATFCKHLVCKACLEGKKPRILGCKWCRNDEDLIEDVQSKILIGLYKQLCAILKDLVTRENTDTPGTSTSSNMREKILTFLNEGCSLPDFVVPKIEEIVSDKQPLPKRGRRGRKIEVNIESCPPCCCTCEKKVKTSQSEKGDNDLKKTDISNDPIKITAAQSSEERISMVRNSPGYASDSVTSTVPDSLPPPDKPPVPKLKNHNKDGGSLKIKNAIKEQLPKREKRGRGRPVLSKTTERANNFKKKVFDTKLRPLKKYEADLPTTKEEQTSTTITTKPKTTQSPLKRKSLLHVKEKLLKEKERQLKEKIQEIKTQESPKKIESPLRIQPLKLTVKKTNSSNISYKIQFKPEVKTEVNEETSDAIILSDKDEEEEPNLVQKAKRKATFVSNYAMFSDESDFEPDTFKKKAKWTWKPLENRDSCSCGASSNVKYFTDICKRARCPCYSQGRACVNCKCRFCSNPYLLDDEEICTDSDTSSEGSQIIKNEIEDIDVETM